MPASAARPAREPLVPATDEGQDVSVLGPAFYRKELKIMWTVGWPIAVSFFCRFAMMSMDSAFVGHIRDGEGGEAGTTVQGFLTSTPVAWGLASGPSSLPASLTSGKHTTKEYLAGATLSDMCTQVIVIPLLAMGFGIGPLVSQAMGANNPKMAGTWLQISMFTETLVSIPVGVLFFYVEEIMDGLGFAPELCELAGSYAKFNAIWIIPNSWYVAVRFYFQSQGVSRPAMYFGLGFLAMNALFNWCLVFGGPFDQWVGWSGMGFIGAAVSISCSRTLQFLFFWLYMFCWRKQHRCSWPGWNMHFLTSTNMRAFLGQTLPQVGAMLMQMAITQSVTLLVARLGTLAVAASSAATLMTMPFIIFFMASLSSLAAIRGGFHLGSGRGDLAKATSWMILAVGACFMVLFAAVAVPLRHEIMFLMTSDKEVQALAADILPAKMTDCLFSSLVQCCTNGILACQGRTKLSSLLSLGFELPLSLGGVAVLVLVFQADVRVVYWAQAAASFLEAIVVLVIVYRSDWSRHADEARARQRAFAAPAVAGPVEEPELARGLAEAGAPPARALPAQAAAGAANPQSPPSMTSPAPAAWDQEQQAAERKAAASKQSAAKAGA